MQRETNTFSMAALHSVFLAALTGSSRISPAGFHKKISTWFDKENGVLRYPKISTCGLELELPRGCTDDDEFSGYMEIAIRSSLECFGLI